MDTKTIKLRTNATRDYILLSEIFDWFEPEIIGGVSASEPAARTAYVIYGCIETVEDFLLRDKKIFQQRKGRFVSRFLDDHGLLSGDLIKIERLAPYTYRFMPG